MLHIYQQKARERYNERGRKTGIERERAKESKREAERGRGREREREG